MTTQIKTGRKPQSTDYTKGEYGRSHCELHPDCFTCPYKDCIEKEKPFGKKEKVNGLD